MVEVSCNFGVLIVVVLRSLKSIINLSNFILSLSLVSYSELII